MGIAGGGPNAPFMKSATGRLIWLADAIIQPKSTMAGGPEQRAGREKDVRDLCQDGVRRLTQRR
jgi:hypothetical protein